jgi:hypothetical protein
MPNPLLELIESGDRNSVSESSYFQAEVTSIDSTTGRIYILRLDDEDGFPDDEPYPVLQGAMMPFCYGGVAIPTALSPRRHPRSTFAPTPQLTHLSCCMSKQVAPGILAGSLSVRSTDVESPVRLRCMQAHHSLHPLCVLDFPTIRTSLLPRLRMETLHPECSSPIARLRP